MLTKSNKNSSKMNPENPCLFENKLNWDSKMKKQLQYIFSVDANKIKCKESQMIQRILQKWTQKTQIERNQKHNYVNGQNVLYVFEKTVFVWPNYPQNRNIITNPSAFLAPYSLIHSFGKDFFNCIEKGYAKICIGYTNEICT